MTISVIIPTYNRNDLLFERAIPSVLAQTLPVDEILIVADGMQDPELEDLSSRFRDAQFDAEPTLRLWNIDRQPYPTTGPEWGRWGLYAVNARNFGIEHARGDWLMLLDDDDELESDAIRTLSGIIDDETEFAYGRSLLYKDGKSAGQIYGYYPPGDAAICHGAFLMRAGMPWRYALDSYDRGRNADADLWIRMREGGVRFRFVPEIVLRYHRNYP